MKLKKLLVHPLVIIAALVAGAATGVLFPSTAHDMKFIGEAYVDLLKVVVLPFLLTAVVVSISRLSYDSRATQHLRKIICAFLVGMVMAGCIALACMIIAMPGVDTGEAAGESIGRMIQTQSAAIETSVELLTPYVKREENGLFVGLLMRLVPSNIFLTLSQGDTLKALVFMLLLGSGLASIGRERAHIFIDTCDAVFRASQWITIWLLYLLPLASFSLLAEQAASTGLEPIRNMLPFIAALLGVATICIVLCIVLIRQRSGRSFRQVLQSQREPFFIALVTRSSAASMPAMTSAMQDKLPFDKSTTELVVPLGIALFRIGPLIYYVVATIFVAQLYGRVLSPGDYAMVLVASVIAGFASSGMNGIVTISQTSVVCSLLGIPFEAAFILFVAIDPICETLRTVLQVISTNALVAVIAPIERRTPERVNAQARFPSATSPAAKP